MNKRFKVSYRSTDQFDSHKEVEVECASAILASNLARSTRSDIHYIVSVTEV